MSNEAQKHYHYELQLNLQEGQYIADAITPEMMAEWQLGHKILITSNTGTGKTYFIMSTLYQACKAKGYKALLLTNRVSLKEQLISLYGEQSEDVITIMNYQSFAEYIKFQPKRIENKYTIVIADEAHFFFSDSTFSNETDIPLNYLVNDTNNELVIFISATSKILQYYFGSLQDHKIDFNYQFIRPYRFKEYYYWSDIEVIRKMLLSLPKDEKAIYFCSNIKQAYKLYMDMRDSSAFICATNNPKFGKYCSIDTLKSLKENQKFEEQILFTTSVIENGINIIDPQVKHIIIDLKDFDTIIQCIGRRRITDKNDLPSIYVKQFKQSSLQTQINNLEYKMKPLEYFRTHNNDDFNKQYGKKSTYGLIYTESLSKDQNICQHVVNSAREMKYKYDMDLLQQINKDDGKFGHLKYLCDYMQIPFEEFQDLSLYYDQVTILDKLNYYLDKQLFGEDKSQFIDFLKKDVLKPLQGGYKVCTINKYFEDINIPYYIKEDKENSRKSPNRNKRYWILKLKILSELNQAT